MNRDQSSDRRAPILTLVAVNISVPLLIGGLIAVAESGDLRVLSVGVAITAICAGIGLAGSPLQRRWRERPDETRRSRPESGHGRAAAPLWAQSTRN